MTKRRHKSKWKLLRDLSGAKAGMIFEWDRREECYTTKQLPWYLTPLVPFNYITRKSLFERID